ncbi:hypothetical protein JG688_00018718 [Phytophthora aleatoria]|uniref:Helitron helicase-like domain-containing protein n=1 Tax=Phytophthora aleatoria TaxID=2496075 RepID=A0A8J5IBH3_9STRA|nr:hypothetical protein JG688_00018718 [Phytophthora aleatoria]
MVETQGRGTLHDHFLIWLCRCPPNAESFEKQVATDGEIFLNEVAQYADSTNQLPIPLDSGNCANCGETFATLVPLPIPVKARENIVGRFVGRRVPPHIRELLLVSCCRCNAQLSSQHALRRLLLMNWPVAWPPAMIHHTQRDIIDQAIREAESRMSIVEAENLCKRFRYYWQRCVTGAYGDQLSPSSERFTGTVFPAG